MIACHRSLPDHGRLLWEAEVKEKQSLEYTKPRIPQEKRKECLDLFEKGNGYKRTATITGLNAYTGRDYRRRYASGDTTWAYRGSDIAVR